jgi:acyl carrier protein
MASVPDEILPKLGRLFEDVLELDSISLTRNTTAEDVAGWDSVANVRLMIETEREFKVKFTTAEITSLSNVGELVDLIIAKRSKGR